MCRQERIEEGRTYGNRSKRDELNKSRTRGKEGGKDGGRNGAEGKGKNGRSERKEEHLQETRTE